MSITQDQVINAIQKGLTIIGTTAASFGYAKDINWVEISGFIVTVVTFIWSHKWNAPTPPATNIGG